MKNKRKIMVATFVQCGGGTSRPGEEAPPTQTVLTSFEFVEVDLEKWAQEAADSPFKAEDFLIPVSRLLPPISIKDEVEKPQAAQNGVEDEI